MTLDPRRYAPATARNRDPILSVLRDILPQTGTVLEIASGTGEHVAWFAAAFPGLTFQPSERTAELLSSIAAHAGDSGCSNIRPALHLDVTSADPWSVGTVDAAYNCNMIHIAPWTVAEGLMRGLGAVLKPAAPFMLYGPFKVGGVHTALSNAAFDESLQAMNSSYGVRDLEAVVALAEDNGLALQESRDMPANNKALVFRRG
ncbi:MAG: DUF938 domain-containing protein [Alphaproteobacteria bacterium]